MATHFKHILSKHTQISQSFNL